MAKFNLFGTRVLLRHVPMKQGRIFLPQIAQDNQLHKLAEVVAVGNGRWKGQQKELIVKKGDIVFFQTNMVIAANCCYEMRVNGSTTESLLNLEQTDCVARLKSTDMKLGDWEMLGEYVLVRPKLRDFESETGIVIPDTVQNNQFLYYHVEKFSPTCMWPLKKGQEVIIVHGRANPIMIGNQEFAYLRDVDVHGIVEDDG